MSAQIEECISVPDLNLTIIQDDLIRQAEGFRDGELLAGVTLGGLYVCPKTYHWLFSRVHTDLMAKDLPENPSTEQINEWLGVRLSGDIKDLPIYPNDPIDVRRPGRTKELNDGMGGRRVSVYLDKLSLGRALRIGNGNVSMGIRRALDSFPES